jgi:hypothetical protein
MHQSPKRQTINPEKGTCTRHNAAEDSPQNAESFFLERDMHASKAALFGTDPHKRGLRRAHAPLPYMLSRQWLRKSSANYLVPRGFAQKGFAISILGHFFCPFPDNFIESCRVKTKNNKIKIQDLL